MEQTPSAFEAKALPTGVNPELLLPLGFLSWKVVVS
jgi:hypothetical protein